MRRIVAQYTHRAAALVLALATGIAIASCAAPRSEPTGSTSQHIDARFDPSTYAPAQSDPWSCSVYTTTWMLRATGHDVSWGEVASRMKATGRVTEAYGLSDAGGPGVAQTLRDFDDGGGAAIQNQAFASFDDVAARAGRMAVGIGGRNWYHWSGVRGYDAARDVLLLANSAPGYRGVGQELTRGQFEALGAMALVWMDYGQVPEAPPFEPSERPTDGPFPALHVKGLLPSGQWLTQCNESADGERVWQGEGEGPDTETRWARAKYPQAVAGSCGTASQGTYPIVLRNFAAGGFGAWITQCTGTGEGLQHVFRIEDGVVDGHPAATFLYNEAAPGCE